MADETQFGQLIQNLLSNSIKFKDLNRHLRIKITSQTNGDNVVIAFQDNGIGMPKNQLKKVFDVFKQLNAKPGVNGTGMGLAICKRIMDLHQGEIWVESEEGQGSTFYLQFQRATKEQGD